MFSLAGKSSTGESNEFRILYQLGTLGSTGDTWTVPNSVRDGDLMVYWNMANDHDYSIPTYAIPSGFTQVDTTSMDVSNVQARVIMSYKIMSTSDRGAVLTGMSGHNEYVLGVIFRYPEPVASVTGLAGYANGYFDDSTSVNATFGATSSKALYIGANSQQYPPTVSPGVSWATQTADRLFNTRMAYYDASTTLNTANTYEGQVISTIGRSPPSNAGFDMICAGRIEFTY